MEDFELSKWRIIQLWMKLNQSTTYYTMAAIHLLAVGIRYYTYKSHASQPKPIIYPNLI